MLLAASFVLLAPCARADAEADAKDLFARGRELRVKGSCAQAVPVFKKAHDVFPAGLGSLRNVAECEEELHHFASARRAWLDLKRALVISPDPKYQGWDTEAQAAATRLAPLVATLTIDVVSEKDGHELPRAEIAGLTVRVNDEPLASDLLGTPLERDPGAYTVQVAQPPPGARAEGKVTLAQGDTRKLTLRLAPMPVAHAEPPGTPPPVTEDPNAGRRLAGYVTLGVGALSLAGAGISFVVRQSAKDSLDSACSAHTGCDPSLQSTVDRGHLAATLTNVFLGLGVVATGAGVALVLTSPNGAASRPQTGLTLRPMLGRAQGITAEWSLP